MSDSYFYCLRNTSNSDSGKEEGYALESILVSPTPALILVNPNILLLIIFRIYTQHNPRSKTLIQFQQIYIHTYYIYYNMLYITSHNKPTSWLVIYFILLYYILLYIFIHIYTYSSKYEKIQQMYSPTFYRFIFPLGCWMHRPMMPYILWITTYCFKKVYIFPELIHIFTLSE